MVSDHLYKMCVYRFEFSVSMVELHRRTLDVAVKNGGSILSKHKGLLGKVTSGCHYVYYPAASINSKKLNVFLSKLQVLVDLSSEDISKGWTQWYTCIFSLLLCSIE